MKYCFSQITPLGKADDCSSHSIFYVKITMLIGLLAFSGAGIGFIADTLQANDCDGEKWKMCNFLKLYVDGVLNMKYFGRMLPKRVTMVTREKMFINLGLGLQFFKETVISKLNSTKGGDRLSFEGDIYLTRTSDKFPGMHVNLEHNAEFLCFLIFG